MQRPGIPRRQRRDGLHDLLKMLLQLFDRIAESLLPGTFDNVDILPDLAGVQLHALSQIPAGNLGYALRFQLLHVPIVGRQPLDQWL